jgi:hypothetical protein
MYNGSEVDLRAPLFIKAREGGIIYRERSEILEMLRSRVEGIAHNLGEDFVQREEEEAQKIGNWSSYKGWPEDGPEKALAVYSDKSPSEKFVELAWDKALEWLSSLVPKGSIEHMSIEESVVGIPHSNVEDDVERTGMDLSTNSGFPFVGRWFPSRVLTGEAYARAKEAFDYYLNLAKRLKEDLNHPGAFHEMYAISGQRLVQKVE